MAARVSSAICVAVMVAAALPGAAAQTAGANPPANADPPASANSPVGANSLAAAGVTRPQKIHDLVGYLGYGADTKHIDAAVPYLTANVAPSDPTWNSTHPRWRPVSTLIGRNLRDDAEEEFAESQAAIAKNAVQAMSDGVVAEDLDGALAFFRSTTGQHFLELQSTLSDLSIEISLEKDTEASGVSVENLDSRRRVLELWLPVVFIRAMYGSDMADRLVETTYQKYSRLRGSRLDALARRYAEEVPKFEEFAHSTSLGRIINAEKQAGQKNPGPNLPAFFAAEAKRHASEWHAAYLGS